MVDIKHNRVGIALKPARGQALVEYALILVLLAVGMAFAIAATGPAIGNVFCNVVDNLAGEGSADVCGRGAGELSAAGGAPVDFWATVTWIAANPQQETPFPTPIQQPPTSAGSILQTNTYTPTPSITPTPSNTPTPTPTDTLTPSLTPSIGPSPTPEDYAFDVPHVDQVGNPRWWRLDGSDFWLPRRRWRASGTTTPARPGATDAPVVSALNSTSTSADNLVICSPVGTGLAWPDLGQHGHLPAQVIQPYGSGGYGAAAIFTSTNIARTVTVDFTLTANNYLRLRIRTAATLPSTTASAAALRRVHSELPDRGHPYFRALLRGRYNTGASNMSFSAGGPATINTDDSAANCPWGQVNNAGDSNSPNFQFDNLGAGGWTGGATCHLELRGYVNVGGVANPVLSFWDLWDFTGTGSTTATIEFAEYVDGINEAWGSPITLHSSGSNYNWTRNEVPIASYGGTSQRVTFRFKLNSSGGTPFRWHIDDLQVTDEPLSADFYTIGDYWNLDTRVQMNDFLFNADTDNTLQNNPGLPQTTTAWRWDLTSTIKRGPSGYAWDQSPGTNYQKHSSGSGERIYYLEFKRLVDLASPPATDLEGDTGTPLLTFWMAYDVPDGGRLSVEYTTDSRDTAPDTWTTVPNGGLLLNFTSPGTPGPNEQTARSNTVMQKMVLDLTQIPVSTFRLRFALTVQNNAASTGDGWYIDDIYLEREDASPYFAYPFYDDAESDANFTAYWTNIGDWWGRSAELPNQETDELAMISAGALSSGWTYSDSPSSNYPLNTVNTLELISAIDLLNDTPENSTDAPGRLAASEPLLTFWHRRSVGANVQLNVEMWTAASASWTTIWSYDSAIHATTMRRQDAWERIEVNLRREVEDKAGANWAAIAANADSILDEDDIRIRFVFDTDGTASDGVYVDEISIDDAGYSVFKLWPTAIGGSGMFVDYLDSTEGLGLPIDWTQRYHGGGIWDVTTDSARTGSLALAGGPGGAEYMRRAEMYLEMVPIIDLTSTPATQDVRMYFWTNYEIGANSNLRVEIAAENASESPTVQTYGKMGGWTAWTEQPITIDSKNNVYGVTNSRVDTWGRAQVNLTGYIGSRVRIRFSMESSSTDDMDVFIDDISLIHGLPNKALIFSDNANSIANWVSEGSWGITEQYFVGTGGSVEDLGPSRWLGWYFDCSGLGYGWCDSTSFNNLVQEATPVASCPPGSVNYLATAPVGPECVTDINMFLGSTALPLGGLAPAEFYEQWAARWTRTVTLKGGATYRVEMVSDDGIRLSINDVTNTSIAPFGGGPGGYIVNNWDDHGPETNFATFTVDPGPDLVKTLTLDFYENGGGAVVYLAISQRNFSFSDSPNTPSGSSWTVVDSAERGDSALILDGYFNFTGRASPTLSYQALYTMGNQTPLYVEVSGNGGFTWTTVDTIGAGWTRGMVSGWETRLASLAAAGNQSRSMIRFRMDARSATDSSMTDDGVWIAGIQVN
ncbi:MAG: hypothetical protein IPK19_34575 [Chloroflexi bacterium]|nr:hypothetical protein [Chloroflexota bacterium]